MTTAIFYEAEKHNFTPLLFIILHQIRGQTSIPKKIAVGVYINVHDYCNFF